MQLTNFLRNYPNILFNSEGDAKFTFLRLMTHGMCSVRMVKLLNYACKFLEGDEYYLEIGTYTGFSLISAGYESGRQFVGVDNFSEAYFPKLDVRKALEETLTKYPGGYSIIDSDFRAYDLDTCIPTHHKMGVFLVDGKHTYEDVIDSVNWAKKYLAPKALIFFDDLNVPGVKKAVEEIRQKEGFEEVLFANSFYDSTPDLGMSSDPYIHNGFSMMKYEEVK